MNKEFKQIGMRIREMREVSGLSVDEVVKELGVVKTDYLEYEESGENVPISVLYDLANLFKVDMNEILTGQTPRLDDYCLVKKGCGTRIERFPGYSFKSLAARFGHKLMEPLLVTIEPSDDELKLVTHKGQEFNMVLEGRVALFLDDKQLVLEEGDCVYFNSAHPHGQKAMDGNTAVFLTVIAE